MPIYLKRGNGEVTPYKNSEYIPAYYFFPKEALATVRRELQELPRNPWFIFRDRKAIEVVESDLFLELMMDGFAQLAWPHMGMKTEMEIFSGYDPAYRSAHNCSMWIQTMVALGIIPTVEELVRQVRLFDYFDWTPAEDVYWEMRKVVRATMHRYNLNATLDAVKQMRCFEDFDNCYSSKKEDMRRKWYHTRTKHPMVLSEDIQASIGEKEGGFTHEAEDEAEWIENDIINRVDGQRFLQMLDEKNRKILLLRYQGWTLQEIADELGYANHSGVLKRINKIGEAYQQFSDQDIGF